LPDSKKGWLTETVIQRPRPVLINGFSRCRGGFSLYVNTLLIT
jgi:hypothetical protein